MNTWTHQGCPLASTSWLGSKASSVFITMTYILQVEESRLQMCTPDEGTPNMSNSLITREKILYMPFWVLWNLLRYHIACFKSRLSPTDSMPQSNRHMNNQYPKMFQPPHFRSRTLNHPKSIMKWLRNTNDFQLFWVISNIIMDKN